MQYQVKDPQGNIHIIAGPDGATPDQIIQQAQKLIPSQPQPSSSPIMDVAKSAVSAALPSPAMYNQPITTDAPSVPGAALQAAGQTLANPTRISASMSAPAQAIGGDVSEKLGGLGVNDKLAAGAGLVAQTALDPQSYIGAGEGVTKAAQSAKDSISSIVESGLPKLYKWLGNVPENATKTAIDSKFELPKPSQEEIEQSVKNVQEALNKAKSDIGAKLNTAKADIGLPITTAEKEQAIKDTGNVFGLAASKDLPVVADKATTGDPHAVYSYDWQLDPKQPSIPYYKLFGDKGQIEKATKLPGNENGNTWASDVSGDTVKKAGIPIVGKIADNVKPSDNALAGYNNHITKYVKDFKQPEDLVSAIKDFKDSSSSLPKDQQGKVAAYLQDQISKQVDFTKSGSQVEGVLKQQYGDLNKILHDSSPALTAAKSKMSDVLGVFDDLESKLADKDQPGKAEQFLRGIFTGKTPTSKDYLAKLAQLQELSGKPVLTDIFNKLTGESFDKWIGRPTGAHIAETLGVGDLAFGHNPAGALGSIGYLAAQSPKVLGGTARAGYVASEALNQALKSKLAARASNVGLEGVRAGFPMSQDNQSKLQSIRDKLKRSGKS